MKRRAFSLIEVLVAMTLLTLALLFLLPLLPQGLASQRKAQNRSIALQIALEELESTRRSPSRPVVGREKIAPRALSGVVFEGSREIRPVSGFDPEDLLEIETEVHWTERGQSLQVVQKGRLIGARY